MLNQPPKTIKTLKLPTLAQQRLRKSIEEAEAKALIQRENLLKALATSWNINIRPSASSITQSTYNPHQFVINIWSTDSGSDMVSWLEENDVKFGIDIGPSNFLIVLTIKDTDMAALFKLSFVNG